MYSILIFYFVVSLRFELYSYYTVRCNLNKKVTRMQLVNQFQPFST